MFIVVLSLFSKELKLKVQVKSLIVFVIGSRGGTEFTLLYKPACPFSRTDVLAIKSLIWASSVRNALLCALMSCF